MGRYRYAIRQPRGRIVDPPFSSVAPVVVPPIPQFLSTRRPRLLRVSRGRVGTAPTSVGLVPFVVLSRVRRLSSRRTARVFQPPFPPAVVQTLPAIPVFVGHRQPQLLRLRRSTVTQFMFPGAAPIVLPPIPAFTYRRRAPLGKLRRSILLSPIAAPLNTGTGPVVPNMLRRHRWLMRRWEGQSFAPNLVGAAPVPPVPINPVPPNFSGGLSGLSLGKRKFRNKNRPIKSSYDKTLVFRQLWGGE